ncbi:MAG: glycosyltransferase family 9 protein [Alphaproteobacteria bacterium]
MKILFITSSRIGDAVLSSGLLNYIEQSWPDAKVTIACGPLAVSLFEGYPLLEQIIPLKKEKHNKHWIKLWKQVIGTRWDMVIDLRDSAVSRLVRAKQRYIFSKHIDKNQHKAAQNAAVMRLPEIPAPKLWFTDAQKQKAATLIPPGAPVLGVGPTANWIGKTWPAERFVEVVQWMSEKGGVMENARIAVFGAPGEEEGAYKVFNALPENRRLDLIAKGSPGEAAAAIAACDFYLGNDSGLMHCAAAAGVPTCGVFGPSYPHIYAPYGKHAEYVRTPETFDELIDFEGYDPKTLDHTLMETLSAETVKDKITRMFEKRKAA